MPPKTTSGLRIDTKKLIHALGGVTACHKLLTDGGFNLHSKTIEKWMDFGTIPTKRILQLTEACKKVLNHDFDIREYFVR